MAGTLGCLLLHSSPDLSHRGTSSQIAHRRLAGQTLVNWVLRRASEAQQLQALVVSITPAEDSELLRDGLPSNVHLHVSREPDVTSRLLDCSRWIARQATMRSQAMPEGIVQLRLDCPLVDPHLLDRMIQCSQEDQRVDYATFRSTRAGALLQSQLGFVAEYLRVDALERMVSMKLTSADLQNPGVFMIGHSERFQIRLLALPTSLDREDVRLSVRHQDDWDHAEQIVDALGFDQLEWQQIVSLLDRQPVLRERMAKLNLHENQLAQANRVGSR